MHLTRRAARLQERKLRRLQSFAGPFSLGSDSMGNVSGAGGPTGIGLCRQCSMAMCNNDDVLGAAVLSPAGGDGVPYSSAVEGNDGDQQFADWFKNQFPADEAPVDKENWLPGFSQINSSFEKLQERPKGFLPLLADDDEAQGLLQPHSPGRLQGESFDASSWQAG